MQITESKCNFERESLIAPFGFKGGFLTELWQSIVRLNDDNSNTGIGLGVQSVLWSDSKIFESFDEPSGNSLMFLMTSFASNLAKDISWETPMDLIDQIYPLTYEYGKKITGNESLRPTFVLNSLVPVDNAAWLLYCANKNITAFDKMIPEEIKPVLDATHNKLAVIPLMSYLVSVENIKKTVDDGFFFLKIKIGADPDGDGNLDTMLEWDKKRISEIHNAIGTHTTPYTDNKKICYYFDANGRYDSIERMMRLCDHADKIGALDQILILEEPFPENMDIDVSALPVTIAADESAHTDVDCIKRIELGYRAMALKPIAKTMSMSFKIAKAASDNNIQCFCADLTVNPVMIDWNKNVAARLKTISGINIGVVETNGHQNYKNWDEMKKYHPCYGSSWTNISDGLFNLDDDFYASSGGIFNEITHYQKAVSS